MRGSRLAGSLQQHVVSRANNSAFVAASRDQTDSFGFLTLGTVTNKN